MFSRLTVARQLTLAFGAVLAVMLMQSIFSAFQLKEDHARLRTLYEDRAVPLRQLAEVQRYALRDRMHVLDMLHEPTAANIEKRAQEIAADQVAAAEQWKAYAATYLTEREKELVAGVPALQTAFSEQGVALAVKAIQAGDMSRANELEREHLPAAQHALLEQLDKLLQLQVDVSKQEYLDAQSDGRTAERIQIALSVLALGLGLVATVGMSRRLSSQLGAEPAELKDAAARIAAGDLSSVEGAAYRIGSVRAAMDQMRAGLAQVVSTVRQGVDSVATASSQIAAGNVELSARTEEQASSLQQTAASLEQLTGTVSSSAENTKQASRLASDASTAAARAGDAVSEVVELMQGIAASSTQMTDIISVIDGIAFQTNLLALNAAVEAARAGEHGRGFAVVASEVRALAQRSAAAAKEVKTLIGQTTERVGAGTSMAGEAGAAMQAAAQQVRNIASLVSELAAGASEQSAGIGQINSAVTVLDQTTQSNAALVEESAAAAESLSQQAQALAQSVESFRL